MKKRDFISLIAYTVSLLVLALGMCFYTLPEWEMTTLGNALIGSRSAITCTILGSAEKVSR